MSSPPCLHHRLRRGSRRGGRTQGSPLRAGLSLFLLLLTGCGNDRPYSGPPPRPPRPAQATPGNVPLTSPPDAAKPPGPPDPLIGDAGQTPADPLAGKDPLIGQDPLQGRGMPTVHSHWLRGRLRGGRVTVLLNGVRHGSFSGVLDQDITMKLREGANTVTFVFQPQGPGSAADLEIVEGEHHPPIAPLVTFHGGAGGDAVTGDAMKPVTQTFPFQAR